MYICSQFAKTGCALSLHSIIENLKLKKTSVMTNLVSIILISAGFLSMCVLTQLVVEYLLTVVCKLFNLKGGACHEL